MKNLTFVLLVSCLIHVTAELPNFLAITRQDSSNYGYIEVMDAESGSIMALNTTDEFKFKWPLVEMTGDQSSNQVYTIVIPEDGPTRIYQQQSNYKLLTVIQEWFLPNDTIIFDLQYSTTKSTLFGIKVTGTYQRTFSNIILYDDGSISVHELFNLPQYWFVNASTYDSTHNIYYALVNNFPSLPNATLRQQLAVIDFSDCINGQSSPTADGELFNLTTVDKSYIGQLQFLSYSPETSILFGAGINLQTNTAYVVTIDKTTGITTLPLMEMGSVLEIGPLVTHSNHQSTGLPISFFVKTAENTWKLLLLQYNTNAKYVNVVNYIRTFTGEEYKYFTAAVRAYNEY